MDYELDFIAGRWHIIHISWSVTDNVDYQEHTIASFDDEYLARQNWDMVMDTLADWWPTPKLNKLMSRTDTPFFTNQ
jgi:hypothetical protein